MNELSKKDTKNICNVHPAADIIETPEGVRLELDMPGVEAKDLEIKVEENTLIIEALSSLSSDGCSWRYHRRFEISDDINKDKVDAKIKDGVLKVTLPKAETAKTHKIAVANG